MNRFAVFDDSRTPALHELVALGISMNIDQQFLLSRPRSMEYGGQAPPRVPESLSPCLQPSQSVI